MEPCLSYIICTSPRSGSTLLSSTLLRAGVAGRPEEYFVPGEKDEFFRFNELNVRDYHDYVPAVIRAATTPNGIFGLKLHAIQAWTLMRRIEHAQRKEFKSLKAAIDATFPNVRYILLTRESEAAQAVSFYRATMTDGWWSYSEERPASDKTLEFNQYGIKKCLLDVRKSNEYWEEYFRTHKLVPLRLTYEELTKNYEGTIRRVFAYLGLPKDIPLPPPATRKMADERSREWEQKFLELEKENPISPVPIDGYGAPF